MEVTPHKEMSREFTMWFDLDALPVLLAWK